MVKELRNINFLDLTEAEPESLAGVERIKNVNLLLYSDKIAPSLNGIAKVNINNSTKVPSGMIAKMVNGHLTIEQSYLQSLEQPLYLMINGSLLVDEDVSKESFTAGIGALQVNGQIICPEQLKGLVHSKVVSGHSTVHAYPDGARIIHGGLTINAAYVQTLEANARLAVIGNVRLLDDIDAALLQEKLSSLHICGGHALVREQYATMLHNKLVSSEQVKINVVPDGALYLEQDLVIDADSIITFDQAKLYSTRTLQFADDVTPELLRQHIARIHGAAKVIARRTLRTALHERMDNPGTTPMTLYSDRLVINDGQYRLTETELKYTAKSVAIVNNGNMNIDKSISAELLFEKLEQIDNDGFISCWGEQYGIIQIKVKVNNGHIEDQENAAPEDRDDHEENGESAADVIQNHNYLKL